MHKHNHNSDVYYHTSHIHEYTCNAHTSVEVSSFWTGADHLGLHHGNSLCQSRPLSFSAFGSGPVGYYLAKHTLSHIHTGTHKQINTTFSQDPREKFENLIGF